MNKSILSIALALTVAATSAQAERRNIIDRAVINATANGSITHQIERRPTENGATREMTRTNAQGETATRSSAIVRDNEAGVATRTVSGVTGDNLLARTDDGFTRTSSHTDANGNTHTRSADVGIDKSEGSFTKTVTTSGPNGQASTTTSVKRERSVDSAAE